MDIQKVIEGLDALYVNRETEKVEDYLSFHLEQALNEKDAGSAIAIINELIGYYRDTSQYDKLEAYCGKLLPFMEKAGLKDTIHYGTSCLNIANAYRASGKLENSLAHYKQVFEIYDKVIEKNDIRYASLYNNLSLLYQEMGQFDKAVQALLFALPIVKEYPDAAVELGVTYSNLAASYVKINELDKAVQAVQDAKHVFVSNGLTKDYHYTAALSGAGDVYFSLAKSLEEQGSKEDEKIKEYYEKAIESYEKAMLLLKSHVGLTHAWFRIVSNLHNALQCAGFPEQMKGLMICRNYYFAEAKHLFEALGKEIGHADLLSEITVGKVGEGSECFGYDDLLSVDHDFGPGFCLFVTRKQYEEFGEKLKKTYDHPELPKSYMGFERPKCIPDKPRNGVIVIEDFMSRILGLSKEETDYLMAHDSLPENVFLRVSDWQLKTVTNGELFDAAGERNDVAGSLALEDKIPHFERIYRNLRKGYPESVRRKKIAQRLGEMCQSGQYNYQRMIMRGDTAAAGLMIHAFVEGALHLLYLLNKEYAPHDKWLFAGAKNLQKGGEVVEQLASLLKLPVCTDSYEKREMLEWIGTTNKEDEVLCLVNSIAGDVVKLLKEEGLSQSDSLYLEDHICFVLKI